MEQPDRGERAVQAARLHRKPADEGRADGPAERADGADQRNPARRGACDAEQRGVEDLTTGRGC